MSSDPLLERLRAANPVATPIHRDERLRASVVAQPGDPRLTTGMRPSDPWSRRRPMLLTGSILTFLGIVAAVTLALTATPATTPAYALTQNADGSLTVTLNDLTTGIPQLNARLKQMGIKYTVIPITQNCSNSTPVLSAGPGSLSETITIGTENTEPAGVDGYLAAEQLPNGSIGLGIGGMKTPLPTCFSPTPMTVQPSSTP